MRPEKGPSLSHRLGLYVHALHPQRQPFVSDTASTHRCFGGLDTSASLRQASSSWARVLGGVRGGIAGSWVNRWARAAVRECPLLPPHRWCRLARSAGGTRTDSSGEAFFVLWALNKKGGESRRKKKLG